MDLDSACSAVVPPGAVYWLDAGVADCPAVHSAEFVAEFVADLVADFAEAATVDFVEIVVLAVVEVLVLFEFAPPFEDSVVASDLDSELFL